MQFLVERVSLKFTSLAQGMSEEQTETEIEGNVYDKLSRSSGNTSSKCGDQLNLSSSSYDQIQMMQRDPFISSHTKSKPSLKTASRRSILITIVMAIVLVTAALLCVALAVLLLSASQREAKLKSQLEKSHSALSSNERDIKQLQVQLEVLNKSCFTQLPHNISNENNDIDVLVTTTSMEDQQRDTSCSKLPKSSASGYYQIFSSNGSTMRVYCDMKKTCGNVTGGWMRVTSLDMRQPSSQCPSGLCLNTTTPRTCRRCYNRDQISSRPFVTYHVGVSYSRVCGRLLAYQVGSPDGFSQYFSNIFDGIGLTYGEKNIWSFVVALQEDSRRKPNSVCPCTNPRDNNIPKPPSFVGNHYFCDTGISQFSRGTLHSQDLLWDGQGCNRWNQCCSFNNPPWFYRELPGLTREPITMVVNLDEQPSNEDLAIERVDLYVQ